MIPTPGNRLQRAGSAAQSSMFQRRFPDSEAFFLGESSTHLLSSDIEVAGILQLVVFNVRPLSSRAAKYGSSFPNNNYPVQKGDVLFALGHDSSSWVRGVVVDRAGGTDGVSVNIEVAVTDWYFQTGGGGVIPVTSWAVTLVPQRAGFIFKEIAALSGASVTIPSSFTISREFSKLLLTFQDVTFDTATRFLTIRPNGDATLGNYLIAGWDASGGVWAATTNANLIGAATLTAAQTISGWVEINFSDTGGIKAFKSFARSSVPNSYIREGYHADGAVLSSIVLAPNLAANFDGGVYTATLM